MLAEEHDDDDRDRDRDDRGRGRERDDRDGGPGDVFLRPELRGVRAAFVFLTRLPLGGHPYSAADRAWSAAHFPLVGLVIGALTALTLRLLWGVGPLAAALLTIGVQLLITGAFHEDGLADSADALGGGTTRARTLEILKDSRVGTYGAAALVISIAGRAALLATIAMRGRAGALWALPLVACAARTFPIWLMRLLPYATPPEVARNKDVAGTGATQAWVATAWLLLALLVIVPLAPSPITAGRAFAMLAVLAALTVLAGARFRARVGGVTGDFLGATEQLCELGALVVLAWHG